MKIHSSSVLSWTFTQRTRAGDSEQTNERPRDVHSTSIHDQLTTNSQNLFRLFLLSSFGIYQRPGRCSPPTKIKSAFSFLHPASLRCQPKIVSDFIILSAKNKYDSVLFGSERLTTGHRQESTARPNLFRFFFVSVLCCYVRIHKNKYS